MDSTFENTILHYLIALEDSGRIFQLIDAIEQFPAEVVRAHPNSQINYCAQDKFGKTPLFFAIGLGMDSVVDKLLDIGRKKKKDVGVNTPDLEGRTPAMIAAALGHRYGLIQLISNGAHLYARDNAGHDILDYMTMPEAGLRKLFQDLGMNPDRSIYAQGASYLYADTIDATPLVLVDDEGVESLLLLSRKKPHHERLKSALTFAMSQADNPAFNPAYLWKQIEPLSKSTTANADYSILDLSLEKQVKIRDTVYQALFFMACAWGDLGAVTYAIETARVDIRMCDHLERNALHYCVMRKELVDVLIRTQQRPLNFDDCLKNRTAVFQYLIDKGADIHKENKNHNTPEALLINEASQSTQSAIQAKRMLDWWEAQGQAMTIRANI